MKKNNKALLVTLSAVAMVIATVFGTMAYFTDQDVVTNTFTVGQVHLTLDEKNVDQDQDKDGEIPERDKENQYRLIPGHTYEKDPTVTIEKNSEASYVYMTVTVQNYENLTKALPQSDYYADGVFLLQNLCDWKADSPWQYKGFKDGKYRFVYQNTVSGGENGTKLPALFNEITVPGADIDNDSIKYLENVQIVVNAYAVQEAGFDNYNEAWKATFGNNAEYDISNP